MGGLLPRIRLAVLGVKFVALIFGLFAVGTALAYIYDELVYLSGSGPPKAGDVLVILSSLAMGLAGMALIGQLPDSLRARFGRIPHPAARRRGVYGFGTMLAVGVGATLGSPLFILIPENVLQYEIISLASLVLATVLSVAMAKVYSDMYRQSKALGLEGVGGPSFTKVAAGTRSVRYFVSRLSMWVANTALAAYTKIVFLIFVLDPPFLPSILNAYGFSPLTSSITTYALAGAFIAWTILNVLFEQRYLKLLGAFQIVMTASLLLILLYHSLVLGSAGSWNFTGFFSLSAGYGWIPALLINTGYLYLLFFGFQEIQSLERDAVDRSPVPVVSWFKPGFKVERTTYFGIAMVLSVVIASVVNILYGLAVFSAHTDLQGSAIPALFLAKSLLGPGQELIMAAAFLIATVTTFVPAFLAASRHLMALGEDGYMPMSLARLSWVFTIVAIFLLAVSNQDFLVNITDFMVLVSLGIISLSALWIRTGFPRRRPGGWLLPTTVGAGCFVFGGAVYFIDPSVVVFGSMAVIFAYLIFDIMELGSFGIQLFLAVFSMASLAALGSFQHVVHPSGTFAALLGIVGGDPVLLLVYGLVGSSLMLVLNVVLDVRVLRKGSLR